MKEKPLKKQKMNILKTSSSNGEEKRSTKLRGKAAKKVKLSKKQIKEMSISELLKQNPEASKKLALLGLGCAGCPFSPFETLEEGAKAHGLDADELIDDLEDQ